MASIVPFLSSSRHRPVRHVFSRNNAPAAKSIAAFFTAVQTGARKLLSIRAAEGWESAQMKELATSQSAWLVQVPPAAILPPAGAVGGLLGFWLEEDGGESDEQISLPAASVTQWYLIARAEGKRARGPQTWMVRGYCSWWPAQLPSPLWYC
ncbi:uncharacterized protein KY384_002914 [Bacidia gigantensis]|uniref:uncharacterized protein n=1 Tax=Bacidia gigantensis TaxID=2732470 RepID=UPI001D047772|nr:uncharacterized protein KY384_002914 [Bacidia gigantensis]KAG8532429.1 hypothetical protein KY384_002914 [Bacidia gigantensis]